MSRAPRESMSNVSDTSLFICVLLIDNEAIAGIALIVCCVVNRYIEFIGIEILDFQKPDVCSLHWLRWYRPHQIESRLVLHQTDRRRSPNQRQLISVACKIDMLNFSTYPLTFD